MFPFLFLLKILAVILYAGIIAFLLLGLLSVLTAHYRKTGKRLLYGMARALKAGVILTMTAPLILGPLGYFYATRLEPNWIQVRRFSVRDSSFPAMIEDVKIVQIADLHVEKFGYREQRLIRTVNHLKPDVILINGDFVNAKEGWPPAFEVIKQLDAPYGIYAILGNTDYYFAGEGEVLPVFEKLGVKVMRHENVRLDFGARGHLWLAGLSNKYGEGAEYGDTALVDKAFTGIPDGEPKILMIHDPSQATLKRIHDYKPQLILAGDNHGGQVGIPLLWQFSDYANRGPYMGGGYVVDGIPLYVTRGIGMKNLNLRFLCRPEVTVIRLERR